MQAKAINIYCCICSVDVYKIANMKKHKVCTLLNTASKTLPGVSLVCISGFYPIIPLG